LFYHEVSTSPEGLFAKSVIDLDVIIEDRGRFEAVKHRLKSAGNRAFFYGKISVFLKEKTWYNKLNDYKNEFGH